MIDASRAETVATIAEKAASAGLSVGAAESLTRGALAQALGAGDGAAEWFRGGVIAYASEVKFAVLGVQQGPVISALCAEQMAQGVRRVLGADVAVAVTGVGGPKPEEGCPPGTVYVAVVLPDAVGVSGLHLTGRPEEIVEQTVDRALDLLPAALAAPNG